MNFIKILTAIGNPILKNKLLEENFEVVLEDLQYQEAVLEMLKRNKEINILYLNSILPGEYSLYEFINKIIKINSKLRIVVILEKENEKMKDFLNSKNIFDIFFNNKTKIEELINIIKSNEEKNIKKNNENFLEKIKWKKTRKNKNYNDEKKIIKIIGTSGSRKNNICSCFRTINKKQKNINYRFR